MEEGTTYKNTDQHEKILKEQTEVLLISPPQLFKFLTDESAESQHWHARSQELMRGKLERIDQHLQSNSESRRTRFKNLLIDENVQSTCFWITLCIIIAITIVILFVISRRPVLNVYYNYY